MGQYRHAKGSGKKGDFCRCTGSDSAFDNFDAQRPEDCDIYIQSVHLFQVLGVNVNATFQSRAGAIITIVFFCTVIASPLFVGAALDWSSNAGIENRNQGAFPPMPATAQDLREFPGLVDAFYSDRFGLRDVYTGAYFKLARAMGIRPSSGEVTFGQDDWMFLGSIRPGYRKYDDPMGDTIGKNRFTRDELEFFAQSTSTIHNWLERKGIKYLYVIIPNKHSIYFEKLPTHISRPSHGFVTDQLVNYLKEHTDVVVVDLRNVLLREKEKHPVYFKSDTHWNHFGANAAQFEVAKAVQELFPGRIRPELLSENQFDVSTKRDGDLAKLARMLDFSEPLPRPVFRHTCSPRKFPSNAGLRDVYDVFCDSGELRAIIFRDSFSAALEPYFGRYFQKSTYIWGRISHDLLVEYVNDNAPDVVIEALVERSLPYLPATAEFDR